MYAIRSYYGCDACVRQVEFCAFASGLCFAHMLILITGLTEIQPRLIEPSLRYRELRLGRIHGGDCVIVRLRRHESLLLQIDRAFRVCARFVELNALILDFRFRGAHTGDQGRITSYNVCYTKLLRL